MLANIDDNRKALAIHPFLRLAFRPFFSLGALFSVLAIGWWGVVWLLGVNWNPYGGKIWWHAHEMAFGFAPAIVTGFLLTAVQNWTGITGLRGKWLGLLVASWLLGRVAILLGAWLPPLVVVFADLLFLPAAALAMAWPLLRVKMWGNILFVPILLMMALFNGVSHWGAIHNDIALSLQVIHGGILLVTFVAALIGGRVMPMFTAIGANRPRIEPIELLDLACLFTLLVVIAITVFGYDMVHHPAVTGFLALAALLNLVRVLRMGFWQCWQVPLLWSLHLAFFCIPLGLVALTLHSAGWLASYSAALHTFSVGAIGGMILSMTSRVSLGHTGRMMVAPKGMSVAFVLILVAALARVVIPGFFPVAASWGIGIAALCWVIAYGIFVFYYFPMLTAERIDKRPG